MGSEMCIRDRDLWRPRLHVTGVVVPGFGDFFYIMDPDMKKDANMEMTVIARTLDIVNSFLQ